jgi:quercetin dioxygenase-like cupin family protein
MSDKVTERHEERRGHVDGATGDIRRFLPGFTWQSIPILAYKEEGSHFRSITRQVLFEGDADLPCQARYFEIAAGGHSTLERHQHVHVVMVLRGSGRALVGDRVIALAPFDVVRIAPGSWHQFRADREPFGFLCMVNVERDRPERPDAAGLAELRATSEVAEFIRL